MNWLRIYSEPRTFFWYIFIIGYLPILNTADNTAVMVVVFTAAAIIVGIIGVDTGRARIYGAAPSQIRRHRFIHASIMAGLLVMGLLPGWLIGGKPTFWAAVAGSVIGMLAQLRRAPERSFEPRQPWTLSTDKARGVRYDILVRPMLAWILIPITFIGMYLIMGSVGYDDMTEIIPASMGYSGAVFAGMAILLKNQMLVSKIYGRSALKVYIDSAVGTGLFTVILFASTLFVSVQRVEHFEWWHCLPLVALTIYLHLAILLAAYRKYGVVTPVLLFLGLIGLSYGTNTRYSLAFTVAVTVCWLIMVCGYLPIRVRSGYFGTSGFREMMGNKQKFAL